MVLEFREEKRTFAKIKGGNADFFLCILFKNHKVESKHKKGEVMFRKIPKNAKLIIISYNLHML